MTTHAQSAILLAETTGAFEFNNKAFLTTSRHLQQAAPFLSPDHSASTHDFSSSPYWLVQADCEQDYIAISGPEDSALLALLAK